MEDGGDKILWTACGVELEVGELEVGKPVLRNLEAV